MDCEWSGWGWKEDSREAWLMAGLWGKLPTECLYPVPPLYKTLALLWRSESVIINAFPVCWPSKMHSSKPCDHLYPLGPQHGACISHRYIVALRFWSGCCNKILYAALSVLEAVGILFPSSLNVLLCCVFRQQEWFMKSPSSLIRKHHAQDIAASWNLPRFLISLTFTFSPLTGLRRSAARRRSDIFFLGA